MQHRGYHGGKQRLPHLLRLIGNALHQLIQHIAGKAERLQKSGGRQTGVVHGDGLPAELLLDLLGQHRLQPFGGRLRQLLGQPRRAQQRHDHDGHAGQALDEALTDAQHQCQQQDRRHEDIHKNSHSPLLRRYGRYRLAAVEPASTAEPSARISTWRASLTASRRAHSVSVLS